MVDIAQLVSVPGCGPGGRGFESHYSPHNDTNPLGYVYSKFYLQNKKARLFSCKIFYEVIL